MALNFPNPDSIQTYTNAGITWTWNPTLGVWSTEGNTSDNEFLSKVNDDTAAGAITFEGKTTHEGGVSVTGGSWQTVNQGITQFHDKNGNPANGISLNAEGQVVLALGHAAAYKFQVNPAIDGTTNYKYGAVFGGLFTGTANTEAYCLLQPNVENLIEAPSVDTFLVFKNAQPNVENLTTPSCRHRQYIQPTNNY